MLDSKIYSKKYFESERCEGFYEYKKNELSPIKKLEIDCLNLNKRDRVLDIGCGRGDVEAYLSNMKIDFCAIDYSNDSVLLTRSRLKRTDWKKVIKADAKATGLASRKFSKVLIGDVVEHMTYDEALAMINEAYRLLKPGGMVLVHTAPNVWFKRYVYPITREVLTLLGFTKIALKLKENVDATYIYHIDEYSIIDLNRLMAKSNFNRFKVWINKDSLRVDSPNYLTPLKRNFLFSFITKFINNTPLIYLFGNDLFAIGYKK